MGQGGQGWEMKIDHLMSGILEVDEAEWVLMQYFQRHRGKGMKVQETPHEVVAEYQRRLERLNADKIR